MAYIGSAPTTTASRKSQTTYRYLCTAGQSVISGSDLNNNTLSCDPLDTEVFMNGLKLDSTDTTITTTQVTLAVAAAAGDEIEVVAYRTFESADHYTKSAADTRYVNATGDTMSGNLLLSSGSVGVGTTSPLRQLSALSTTGNAEVSLVSGTSNQCSILMGDGTTGTDIYKGYLQYDNNTDGMLIATNATSRINIDSSGRVTMPYQPYIELRGSSASRIMNKGTVGVYTAFSQQTAVGMTWNSSNGRITVPVAGKYLFLGKFYQWIDNATNHWIIPRLNGTPIAEYQTDMANIGGGGNTDHVVTTADIVNMVANDYVDYRMDADIYGGYPHTNLQAFLLG